MTFSSLLRFITYSSGMWTKTVEEDLSISSVSYEAIFFYVATSKKGCEGDTIHLFSRGKYLKIRLAPP